jgi:hypothetical protein
MATCSRRPWFGIVGILLGCLAVAAAILPFVVPLTATPKPRDTVVIERLQGIKDRIFARRNRVERVAPERNTPARNIAWFEILFATAIALGALAMILAVVSLFAREPWRLGVTAAELGAGAIMIEVHLVLAVAIMFAALLTVLSDALDFLTP